jgi:hypothetical protein
MEADSHSCQGNSVVLLKLGTEGEAGSAVEIKPFEKRNMKELDEKKVHEDEGSESKTQRQRPGTDITELENHENKDRNRDKQPQ